MDNKNLSEFLFLKDHFPLIKEDHYFNTNVNVLKVIDGDLIIGLLLYVKKQTTHITYIAVDKNSRRKKIATWLINILLSNTNHTVTINVRESNKPMLQLLSNIGFDTSSTILQPYIDGEKKISMYKKYEP